jgi:hypothetical protein
MDGDLFHTLSADVVDPAEIGQLLLAHFKSARQDGQDAVIYPNAESDYALRVLYDGLAIDSIETGSAITPADVETLVQAAGNRGCLGTQGFVPARDAPQAHRACLNRRPSHERTRA